MHHGLANAVMIDFALKYNVPSVPDRFKVMAQTVGLAQATPEAFINWLAQLKKDAGIPSNLAQAGVDSSKLEQLVKVATEDGCHPNNPRACTAETFRQVFKEAL